MKVGMPDHYYSGNSVCSNCKAPIGPGVAKRTDERYGAVYCVPCGEMIGQQEINEAERLVLEEGGM